jgi:ketose-bisphosphate aldolase
MFVNTREMLLDAHEKHYAIPSPDYYNSHSIRACMKVAEELNQPVILAYAQAHAAMMSMEEAVAFAKLYAANSPVPVALHLDHGQDKDFIMKAIDMGFTSVMIDASSKPFEENVALTKEIVLAAHQKDISVEAEIGHVGTGENYSAAGHGDTIYTEVDKAVEFVKETGVDSLAVSIGTAHGKYKGTPVINFDRLHELSAAVSIPLVLHGGSSSGDANLERCATEGINKVNIFTDLAEADMNGYLSCPEGSSLYDRLFAGEKGLEAVLRRYYHVFHCDR